MNAPGGQKECPICAEPMDDAQVFCSVGCDKAQEFKDAIAALMAERLKMLEELSNTLARLEKTCSPKKS